MQASKKIAKNYAQALLELASNDVSHQETLLSGIVVVNKLMNLVKGAKQVFESPNISKDEKKAILKKLFEGNLNQKNLNFLFLLIDKQRFRLLPEIEIELTNLVNKNKGLTIAKVSSTSELDLAAKETLRENLERILENKQKVTIEATVDPNLIGGIVVRLNDLIYDGSIKGRLENLKRRLG